MSRGNALIGCTGFVGGNLARQARFDRQFNSANIASLRDDRYDVVVCAAPSAVKWKANMDPDGDLRIIHKLMDDIRGVDAGCFIHISTVDVYPRPVEVYEDSPLDVSDMQPYGKHRFMLEEFVRNTFPRHLIVRLPALFGPGLKKNFVYDIMHDNRLDLTDRDSEFQFYCIDRLWRDISIATDQSIETLNITSEPVSTREVALRCAGIDFDNRTEKPPARYDVRSRYDRFYGGKNGYLYGKETVLDELKAFVSSPG